MLTANDWYHPSKYARIEAERRFLLRALPSDLLPGAAHVRLIDHYLPDTRLRLRRVDSPEGAVLVRKLGQKFRTPDQDATQTMMTTLLPLNSSRCCMTAAIIQDMAGSTSNFS